MVVPYPLRPFISLRWSGKSHRNDDEIDGELSQFVNFSRDGAWPVATEYTDNSDTDIGEADTRKALSDSDTAYSSG